MLSAFLAFFIPYLTLVGAFDSFSDEEMDLDTTPSIWESSNFPSTSYIISSDLFVEPEGTNIAPSDFPWSQEETDIAWTDTFLDPGFDYIYPDLAMSDDINSILDDGYSLTGATLLASCDGEIEGLGLIARDGTMCLLPSQHFQIPPDLRQLFENPLEFLESGVLQSTEQIANEPYVTEEDNQRLERQREQFKSFPQDKDPCTNPKFPQNMCCNGPLRVMWQGSWYEIEEARDCSQSTFLNAKKLHHVCNLC